MYHEELWIVGADAIIRGGQNPNWMKLPGPWHCPESRGSHNLVNKGVKRRCPFSHHNAEHQREVSPTRFYIFLCPERLFIVNKISVVFNYSAGTKF